MFSCHKSNPYNQSCELQLKKKSVLELKVLLSWITTTTVRVGLDSGYIMFFSPSVVMGFSIIEKTESYSKLVVLRTRYIDVVQRVSGKFKRRLNLHCQGDL